MIDDTDRLITEKRLDNELRTITDHLQPFAQDIAGVVVESTYNWYWLVDGLIENDYTVHLTNTLAIKQYNGIKHTNDESDARFLAHLLRLNILPTGYIYPKAQRHVRDVLRRRLLLVRQRTAQLLSLQSKIMRHTGIRLTSHQVKRLTQEKLALYFKDATTLFTATHALQLIQQLKTQVEKI
jgi:transposase